MDLSQRRVLITGGAGFIGSHLAAALLDADNDVRVVDDFSTGTRAWVPADATIIEADLTDPTAVTEAVTPDLDIVFHLAARTDANDDDPRGQFAENTTMTHHLLD